MQALRILGSLQCVRELQCPPTKRRISGFNFGRSFNHNPWQWRSRSFFVSCDFLRQLHFWSHHLPRSATQTFPVRRFPSVTQCLSRPTFASHHSIIGNAQNCSSSIMMTNKDSLSRAACKRTSPFLRNQTFSPNCVIGFLHLRPVLLNFTRLSVFANSHLVHDLRCKTRKPTE